MSAQNISSVPPKQLSHELLSLAFHSLPSLFLLSSLSLKEKQNDFTLWRLQLLITLNDEVQETIKICLAWLSLASLHDSPDGAAVCDLNTQSGSNTGGWLSKLPTPPAAFALRQERAFWDNRFQSF